MPDTQKKQPGLIVPAKFPHLLKEDGELLAKHILAAGNRYINLEYDVPVGHGAKPTPDVLQASEPILCRLTQRRIDCVAHTAEMIIIIEVTHDAGLTAVGQLISYPILYLQTYFPQLPVTPLLVARSLRPDIKPVLEALKLQYNLYP